VRALKNAGIQFDQLIEEGSWVHASFDPRMRRELLTARFDASGTPTYTRQA
jgi:putative chitinase